MFTTMVTQHNITKGSWNLYEQLYEKKTQEQSDRKNFMSIFLQLNK